MQLRDLQNKKIMVWGLGKEGSAILEFLLRKKIPAELYAYNDTPIENFALENVSLHFGEELSSLLDKIDIIIKSPGVSIYKDAIMQAKQKGIFVTSSSDLFISETRYSHPESIIIGISGSKGKSTTSSLMYTALKACGCDAALGGNIGRPLIELIDEKHDFIVAELSSYQCCDLNSSPHIVLFTNLFPEHIDWHLTHDNYYRDKVHLIANQKKEDVCFVNAKCEKLCRYCAEYPRDFLYYNQNSGFSETDNALCFNSSPILHIEDVKLEGYHNLDNMAGVLSVIKYLNLDIAKAIDSFKTFTALPHRLQKIGTKNNVAFFNDSISTAPETAMAAISSFDNNIGIILGGYDRQQDYSELAEFINRTPRVKAAATLFQTGSRIAETLKKLVTRNDFVLINEDNLKTSVLKLWQEMQQWENSMLLFSPAAPSYDAYKSFEKRGEDFIKIFNSL